jgi:hypothetical protein
MHAYTFSLLYLLKTNELAKEFVEQNGFELFSKYLDYVSNKIVNICIAGNH